MAGIIQKKQLTRDGMHASNRFIDTLHSLGLTEYQAKAYLALLLPGTATAEEVSRASGVPRSKVYLVLDELKKKRWVEVERGRPLRFTANDPRRVIDEKMEILSEETAELKSELGSRYESPARAAAGPGGEFISTQQDIIRQELELISGAQHIIVLTGALYFPEELEAVVPCLFRAAERGVTVLVVSRARVTVGGKTLDIKDALSDVPGKKKFEETSAGIKKILVDGKRGMVMYADVEKDGIVTNTLEAVVTGNRPFLESFNPR